MAHIRLALSQFRPSKGEYAQNVSRIGAVVSQAAQLDPKPDLVVFPETATSGYFVEGGVKELAVTAGGGGPPPPPPPPRPPIDRGRGLLPAFPQPLYKSPPLPLAHKKKKARGQPPSQRFLPPPR